MSTPTVDKTETFKRGTWDWGYLVHLSDGTTIFGCGFSTRFGAQDAIRQAIARRGLVLTSRAEEPR